MAFGDTELIRSKGDIRLLKIVSKRGENNYCVIGHGRTLFYTDYEDALEEFNLRWIKSEKDFHC